MTNTAAPPRLREAEFADFPQIYNLELRFWRDSIPAADRQRLFTDSPLWPRLEGNWPAGWVFEDGAGRIVGSVTNFPSAYWMDGEEKLAANAHRWAVSESHRSYALMLMDEYFGQERADLFVSAQVGPEGTPVWSAYADRVPVGDWTKIAYAITGYRGFARTALQMKHLPLPAVLSAPAALALRIKDAVTMRRLPDGPRPVKFGEARSFDARFDAFWRELVEQNPGKLLGLRDCATLRWHYGIPLRANRLWILTATRGTAIRAYCVLKLHLRWSRVPTMRLVDYQNLEPDTDMLAGFLKIALQRAATEGCYVLEHHGCEVPKMRMFDELAPYRAAKPAWGFYYRAGDPALAERLTRPDAWDPSEYDGDSSYD